MTHTDKTQPKAEMLEHNRYVLFGHKVMDELRILMRLASASSLGVRQSIPPSSSTGGSELNPCES
jgi:hypothetical protein